MKIEKFLIKKPGSIKDYEYKLELTDDKPFFSKLYPIALNKRQKVLEAIDKSRFLRWLLQRKLKKLKSSKALFVQLATIDQGEIRNKL